MAAVWDSFGMLWAVLSVLLLVGYGWQWQTQIGILVVGTALRAFAEHCIWPGWHFAPEPE